MNDSMSIVLCLPPNVQPFDPIPDETYRKDVELVTSWQADTAGVVGWGDGGWQALDLAIAHPELPRLVLVALPYPTEDVAIDLDSVQAKTLLLYGSADPDAAANHGTAWQRRLPNARLEMVPGGSHDLLVPKWARILSHLAPRRTRK